MIEELKPLLTDLSNVYKAIGKAYSFEFNIPVQDIARLSVEIGVFNAITRCSNVCEGPPPSSYFSFAEDAEQTNTAFYIFGTDDGPCDYAVDVENNKVALLETITGKFFFYLAESEVAFLRALVKLIAFENRFLERLPADAVITQHYRDECIRLAGGAAYAKFYEYRVISEDNMPKGPLYLP